MAGTFLVLWISLIVSSANANAEQFTGSESNPKTESKSAAPHRIGRNNPAPGAGLTYPSSQLNYARYNPYVSGFVLRPQPYQAGYIKQLKIQGKSEIKSGLTRSTDDTGALLGQPNANLGHVILVPVVWTPKFLYPKLTKPLRQKSKAGVKANTENSTLQGINFTIILLYFFVLIFQQKITKPNCKEKKAAKNSFVQKSRA